MKITWITQGGFILEHSGVRLVVDPYLSDEAETTLGLTRLVVSPISIKNLKPDIVFCSHNHIDHLDPISTPLIAEHYPSCRFVGPKSVTDDLLKMAIDPKRIATLLAGEKVEEKKFTLIGTPAHHSDKEAIGVVIQACNKNIYISGDTLYDQNLASAVTNYCGSTIDLALICINGRLGNMNLDEAVNTMEQLKPRVAIPMHYGLFAENTVNPQPFITKCNAIGIKGYLLDVGKTVDIENLL